MSQLLIIGISVCVLLLAGMVADRLLADKVAWQDLAWRLTLLSVLILPLFLIFAHFKWPAGLVQIPVLTAKPQLALEASLESNDRSSNSDTNTETSQVGLMSRQEHVQSSIDATPSKQAQRIDDPNAVSEPAGTKGASDLIASDSFATSMPIEPNIPWLFFVKMTWALGSFYFLIRYIIGCVTIQMIAIRARIDNKTEPQGWAKAIDQATLAAGLKSRITVRPSSSISTPMLIGVICPIILVPESMLKLSSSGAKVQASLTHEAMHIRRADAFWNVLLFVCILIWWPIPIVHWMKKRMFWLRELLCDANVATEMGAANYAESLLQLTQLPCKRRMGLLAVPMHSQEQSLESRVAWILDKSNFVPTPSRIFRRIAWSCLVVAILGFSTIKLVPANSPSSALAGVATTTATFESEQDQQQKPKNETVEDSEVEFRGIVKTAAGKPVAKATVHLRWKDGSRRAPRKTLKATTDHEGRYTLSTDLPGPYRIWAEGDGLTSLEKYLAGKRIPAQKDTNGPITTDITIKKACDYEVTVVSAETKQAIEGAKIEFGWTDIAREYTTGANGLASIRGLATNDWYFAVRAEGYATFFEKTSPQALGTTTKLTFEMQPGATAEITLRDQNDDPISDAYVEVQYQNIPMTPRLIPASRTDANGKLLAKGLPIKTKLIFIGSKDGYKFDNSYNSRRFEVDGKQEIENLTFVGEKLPYGGDVEFEISDEDGQPISGATLKNPSVYGSRYRTATTDPQGKAQLKDLYPYNLNPSTDNKYVIIKADGKIPQRINVKPGPKDQPKLFRVALKTGKTLKGVLLTPAGKPAPAKTSVYFNEGRHGEWNGGKVLTDKEGKFEIRGLEDTTTITVYTPKQYEPIEDIEFDVVQGKETEIRMTPAAVLRVRAIDSATGSPIQKFNVRIGFCRARLEGDKLVTGIRADLSRPGVNVHGTQKEYKLNHQVAGAVYKVIVSAKGYQTKTIERMQTVVESEAKLIDVALTKE